MYEFDFNDLNRFAIKGVENVPVDQEVYSVFARSDSYFAVEKYLIKTVCTVKEVWFRKSWGNGSPITSIPEYDPLVYVGVNSNGVLDYHFLTDEGVIESGFREQWRFLISVDSVQGTNFGDFLEANLTRRVAFKPVNKMKFLTFKRNRVKGENPFEYAMRPKNFDFTK